ncbi:single-pass membrane and coiled-coil domain-containing protein 2 [Tamandua tetradactyla]|uniref:single-pass membrane and coiled-coil domain-containing protein 2 n=1 Tax=Tamandua tetradactyla TaxID=48850 RepID=UPI0040542453
MMTAGDGLQDANKKDDGSLQTVGAAEGAMQALLREITKMDHIVDTSGDADGSSSENSQSDFLHEMETKKWQRLKLEAEQDQDWQSEQDEQEAGQEHEGPQVTTSLQFSEKSILEMSQENMYFKLNHWDIKEALQVKEPGVDHIGWMEKINSIIQKINVTENTVKSLLNEVMSLEGQIERLESHQDLDSDQGSNIEEKITKIKRQLGDMDNKFVQADACNEVHELKEKLIERVENFCKDMTLGKYQMQERKTDSSSPGEMSIEEIQPLLAQAPPPPLVENSPPSVTVWKRALRISILFCVLTFTGLSCYIVFFDPTFIFEMVLPRMLGRQTMWELREVITPFLKLEVEDLLPS